MGETGVSEARLSAQEVVADGRQPDSWIAVLHGIYGAGRNWGAVARQLVEERPEWGALLVDLRQHGESTGFAPPHTVEAAARDLDTLSLPGRLGAVLGHSFGGKVALAYARESTGIDQVWVVDSTPSVRQPEGSAWAMLRILRSVPATFEDRDTAVDALVSKGVQKPVAQWMTTNLEWTGEEYRWRIDLDEMESLLRSFFALDLWDVVESPREGLEVHLVRATDSSILDEETIRRIRAAERSGRVHLHEVEGGHWLNVDNPSGLVDLLADRL